MIPLRDLCWLAGLLEGEGSLTEIAKAILDQKTIAA